MPSEEIVIALKKRYPRIHPLIFQRSLDRARSDADLFDILDTLPKKFPIAWNNKEHRWIVTEDLFLSKNFQLREK